MSVDTATTTAVDSAAAQYRRHSRPLWRRVLLRTETAIIVAIILLVIFAITTVPYFAQPYTYLTMILTANRWTNSCQHISRQYLCNSI